MQQKQLLKELDNITTKNDLEDIYSKYIKVKDSINKEIKIGQTIRSLKSEDYKTGNYQAVFFSESFWTKI